MKKSYTESIEELTLMLMYLTRFPDNEDMNRYQELSWKNYDYNVITEMEDKDLLWQPRNRRGYRKSLYLTEEGREKAKQLLDEYHLSDKPFNEKYDLRFATTEDTDAITMIESVCFPSGEECSRDAIANRLEYASDYTLVACDKRTNEVVGCISAIATDNSEFKDTYFTDASMHKEDGKYIMIVGLAVLPAYHKQGIAKQLMYEFMRKKFINGKRTIFLTCNKKLVQFYEKLGFNNMGISHSNWGNHSWYLMRF